MLAHVLCVEALATKVNANEFKTHLVKHENCKKIQDFSLPVPAVEIQYDIPLTKYHF